MRLIVNPHKIEIKENEAINEREIDISKCIFEFNEEITEDYVKEAYFTFEGKTYKKIIANNECSFPSETLVKKGMIEIGVVAYLVSNDEEIKRYNPSPVFIDTLEGSLKNNAENSEPITPSEMEQFEQELQDLINNVEKRAGITAFTIEDGHLIANSINEASSENYQIINGHLYVLIEEE